MHVQNYYIKEGPLSGCKEPTRQFAWLRPCIHSINMMYKDPKEVSKMQCGTGTAPPLHWKLGHTEGLRGGGGGGTTPFKLSLQYRKA